MSRRARIAHVAGLVLGLALFAGALWLLHRELRRYDVHVLLAAARAIPRHRLALALSCTAASYLVLTLYDVLALEHIGRRLRYGKTAITSFTSCVISHNLGF